MHHTIKLLGLKQLSDVGTVPSLCLNKPISERQQAISSRQIIKNPNLMSSIHKSRASRTTDITGSAYDENFGSDLCTNCHASNLSIR